MQANLFNLRTRSLPRGAILMAVSLITGFLLSDFPHNRPTPLLFLPVLVGVWATGETIRCMRRKWSWYHGGVILLVYADLMALTILLFFLLYPYAHWITASH